MVLKPMSHKAKIKRKKCQFLIGMVLKLRFLEIKISNNVLCQFLIGMVLKLITVSNQYANAKKVSIPHRYGT